MILVASFEAPHSKKDTLRSIVARRPDRAIAAARRKVERKTPSRSRRQSERELDNDAYDTLSTAIEMRSFFLTDFDPAAFRFKLVFL